MDFILTSIIILAAVLLVLVVYVQNPKGGGLSSDFGSAQQIGGVKKTNDFIDKATWTLAGIIMIVSVVLTIRSPKSQEQLQQEAAEENQAQTEQNEGGKGQGQPQGQGQTQGKAQQ
jgi:preprotein translocase subunit SecG